MRILVTWGSKLGGTAGIGQAIAEELAKKGHDVTAKPAGEAQDVDSYDAVLIGGAIYTNTWHRDAVRLAKRNANALRKMPVWLFASGPLDDSADSEEVPPPRQMAVLAERLGARHVIFGGRLPADAKGFPASAMTEKSSGDWRNLDHVRAWARELAEEIKTARPGEAHEPEGATLWRLAAYGFAGWVACTALMVGLLSTVSLGWAIGLHAVAAPIIFGLLSWRYFGVEGARDPLPTAATFAGMVAVLDAVIVAGLVQRNFEMFLSFAGTWLPFSLIFLATWMVGKVMLMMPTEDQRRFDASHRPAHA